MDDHSHRDRQDADHADTPLASTSGAASAPGAQPGAQSERQSGPRAAAQADGASEAKPLQPHRIMLVVGADLRAELTDRPLAYRLVQAIEAWVRRHEDVLSVEILPQVCTDLWYLHHDDLRRLPTVCLGGPETNLLSAYLARHLVEADRDAEVLLQIDPEFTDLQACVWGSNRDLTAHGLELFMERYLDGYLRAVATQIEP